MKLIKAEHVVDIPEGVTVAVKARTVTVEGPRGKLVKKFTKQPMEIKVEEDKVIVARWFGGRREVATVKTVAAHIKNMIVGVTQGYLYKMRLVYAHFPINANINGSEVEIRNFLGDRLIRRVKMVGDTKIVKAAKVKDQLELEGNDIEDVSRSAALITGACKVRDKDLRKILDGVWCSQRGPRPVDE